MRSAYMNQEEFPILILAEPLIIRQYITCIISPLGCRIVSVSQHSFSFVALTFRAWLLHEAQTNAMLHDKAIYLKLYFVLVT